MKFIKEHNFLEKRLEKIGRYNSLAEKNVLLEDDLSNIEVFKLLYPNSELDPINEIEASAFILKGIENSLNDYIDGMQECSCGVLNDFNLDIEEMINTNIETKLPIGLFENLEEFIEDPDELTVKEYNAIQDEVIENNQQIIKLTNKITCRQCGNIIPFAINPKIFISKNSISNLYDQYFNLMFHMNITKQDIDNLPPFERELYMGLLKKKLETTPTFP